jgi:hypothetical protein
MLRKTAAAGRAESMMGDLLEQAPVRGGFWFWRAVIQIAFASILPALLDSAVWAVLGYEFLGAGWRGALLWMLGGMAWDAAARRFFHLTVPGGRLSLLRMGCILAVSCLLAVFHAPVVPLR